MMNRRIAVAAACVIALGSSSTPALELDATLSPYVRGEPVSGTITIAGNHATDDLIQGWADAFSRMQPDVHVTLRNDTRLTTDAFNVAIADGNIDIIPSARELVPAEIKGLAQQLGGPPIVIAVATGSHATKSATHAIALYVNADNPLSKISIEQIREICAPGGKITKWGQLGLTGEWAEQPIRVYTVPISDPNGNPLGIINYLTMRLLDGRPGWRRSIYQVDSNGPAIEQHMLNRIVRQVARERYSIGFSGFAFGAPGAKTLALAETADGPWYAGTPDEVAARQYPLTRTIYLGMNRRTGTPLPPAVREFLRFVLSREGQGLLIVAPVKYLPLTGEVAGRGLAELR
jgi:phosphate transport system substrate-binding protein